MRSAVKKVRTASTKEEAEAALKEAERLLDRAGTKRLVHPRTARRAKSRLAKVVASKS